MHCGVRSENLKDICVMIKLNRKQEIYIQITAIVIFLVLLIPLANKESIISLVFSNSDIRSYLVGMITFVSFVFAVYSFIRLRINLKQLNSKWRYLLYLVILVWFMSNIRTVIGEQVMSFRNGLNAIVFLVDKSEIKYQKDTLGMVYADGHISFRNFSSDTVVFKGILHGDNFLLQNADSIADIHLPDNELSDKQIEIPPKSTYTYQVKFSTELEVNTLIDSKYNGSINRIRRFTIYSDNEKKIFNF